VLRADPGGAARRTARSVEQRRIAVVPDRESTASLFGWCLPAARATAAFERVDAFARARRAGGDARTLDQLRADTFLDLLEGVGIGESAVHRRGVVEISVPWSTLARGLDHTSADGCDEAATLAGFGPVEAPVACDVVNAMVGRRDVAWRFRVNDSAGDLLATGSVATPRTTAGMAALARLIERTAVDTGGHTTPPVEADNRRRTAGPALTRWIRSRDGTCRAPGCRVPASVCDIDHTIDHAAGGLTAHDNLALLCRHHHRLKHQAGWQVAQPTPGQLTWTSPHGPRFTRRRD
jgi:hypothetical protein